ncbi:hypothetical protein [Streptomyces sp. TLI_55]|uniref:hypothetical protein n=1 Tax=Streptomyces sp. TLI_55 TaxID=1938861 RepID=UPI0011815607|nr:hypothetical protein [Streptomyces sp. TLI_55]
MLIALKLFGIAGLLVIMLLAAVLAGVIVAVVHWNDHRRVSAALLRGLKAFAAAVTLELGVAGFVLLLAKFLF